MRNLIFLSLRNLILRNEGDTLLVTIYIMKNIFLAILILACKFSFAQNTKYDIAFVLRGYDSTCYYCDSIDFEPRAKYIVEHLNKLSFEQISTYRIFVNGIDSRSPVNLQSEKDINTLQASLDGWPGSQWDWLRNRTDFWLVVPDNYRPIIVNAIAWMRQTKLDFSSWGNQTNEGAQHYSTIHNNVVRMGPSSASEFLSGLKMPSNYNPYDFKYTEIVLNSKSNARIIGAGAQNTLKNFGVLDSNGNPYNDFNLRCSYVYHSPRNRDFSTGIYTSIHEGIHALGMGTHDIDDSERNLSVMSSFGAIESFSMLPAWDRYYWTKWIPQSTITTDSTVVSDLKGVGRSVDKSKKYIYQVSAGDSLGRGGAYKEKYDGKWYSYTVDNGGTLRFNSAFTNNNRLAPINAYLDVPIVKKLGDTVSLYVKHDGSRIGFDSITYKWYKDDILISVSNRFVINETELIINGVTINDVGLYKCVISNKYGTVTTKQIKLVINCGVSPPQITPNVFVCQNTGPVIVSAQANIGSTLLWYGSNASGGISSTTAPSISSTTPSTTDYYVSQINTQGCESTRSKITVVVNALPAAPVVSNLAYCAGSTTTALTATALSGHTLSWYGTNATGGTASGSAPTPSTTTAGTVNYYVSQVTTATGCESTRSKLVVGIYNTPNAPVLSRDLNNFLVTNVSGITWFRDGVQLLDTTQKIKPTIAGSYTVKTTQNGCASLMSTPYYFLVTDVINLSATEFIKLVPNPFINYMNIDFVVKGYQRMNIDVFSAATGAKVATRIAVTAGSRLTFNELNPGIYFVRIASPDMKVSHQFKMVKL